MGAGGKKEEDVVVFKEIVVPTDFSEHSLRALDYAVEIAERFGSDLKIIYVIEPLLQAADVSWTSVDFEQLNQTHKASAEKQLAQLVEERLPEGLGVGTEILFGKPFVEILKYARRENADLIVIGSRGLSGLKHLLVGSIASRVVQRAHCPVMTVKSKDPE